MWCEIRRTCFCFAYRVTHGESKAFLVDHICCAAHRDGGERPGCRAFSSNKSENQRQSRCFYPFRGRNYSDFSDAGRTNPVSIESKLAVLSHPQLCCQCSIGYLIIQLIYRMDPSRMVPSKDIYCVYDRPKSFCQQSSFSPCGDLKFWF